MVKHLSPWRRASKANRGLNQSAFKKCTFFQPRRNREIQKLEFCNHRCTYISTCIIDIYIKGFVRAKINGFHILELQRSTQVQPYGVNRLGNRIGN